MTKEDPPDRIGDQLCGGAQLITLAATLQSTVVLVTVLKVERVVCRATAPVAAEEPSILGLVPRAVR